MPLVMATIMNIGIMGCYSFSGSCFDYCLESNFNLSARTGDDLNDYNVMSQP
jgi:hypothetical protein